MALKKFIPAEYDKAFKDLQYFGTSLNSSGHYRFILKGKSMISIPNRFNDMSFHPDSFVNRSLPMGYCEFHNKQGWSVIAIVGSPYDKRPGSKCVFFVNEDITASELMKRIKSTESAMTILKNIPVDLEKFDK